MKNGILLGLLGVALAAGFTGDVAIAAPGPGSSAPAQDMRLPLPEIEKLSNGLEIVWFVSDKLPMVDLAMTFRSGSLDDLPGKSGTAELLAASLDRGAGGLTAREIARKVEALGASRYSSSDMDFFRVGMHGLAPDAAPLLDLLAKLVLQPDFPADEVKREKARMIEGWNRMADYGSSLADLAYRRALTRGTPYGRGSIFSARELASLTREDVATFHRHHFTPKNAVLMVVGRVDKPGFRNRIESLFGGWKGELPRRERKSYSSVAVKAGKSEVLLVHRPDLTQAQVRIGFRAPLAQDPRHYSLTVANALLGGYFHSRLNTLIRDRLGLTYGIGSAFSFNLGLATFDIGSATRNESVGVLIRKTLEVLQGFKRGTLPSEEVVMAKEYLIGGFPLSTATLEGVAGRWLMSHLFGLGPNRLNEYVPKVSAVTSDEVVTAVAQVFDLESMVIVVAGDAKAIEPHLKKAKFSVRRLSPRKLLDL